jgi:hypothetical protein
MLKLGALALMCADHVHFVFFGRPLEWLYWFSRLVFPIFALIAAHNLEHHHANPQRYISRLLLYGVIAQPFYWFCFHVPQLNVLFTLAANIAMWWLLQTLKARGVHAWLRCGITLTLASSLPFLEFGWAGMLAMPVYAALMRRGAWWDWLVAFVLAFGIVGFTTPWIMPMVAVVLWALASRLPTSPSPRAKPWMQHAAYAFYPAHLAVIALIAQVA